MAIKASLLLSIIPTTVTGQSKDIPALGAKLISDRSAVTAGESFRVGVLFDVPQGWHIYWKYPGDAGLPPRIRYSSDTELEVSDTQWPVPISFEQGPDLKGFGYEGQVLLFHTIKVPSLPGNGLPLHARLFVLKCSKDLCVPERLKLSLNIESGSSKKSEQAELFEKWASRVPTRVTEGNSSTNLKITQPRKDSLHILTNWTQPESTLKIFVAHDSAISYRAEIDEQDGKNSFSFSIKKTGDEKIERESIDFVLVSNFGAPSQQAFEVSVPVSRFF